MPNIIDSSFQSTTNGQQFSFKGDIDFLQYGIRDGDASILESLIAGYDNTKNYSLSGLLMSSSAGNTTITAGYVYGVNKALGGMIARRYIYAAVSQTFPDPTGSDVIIGTVTPYSQAYADPTNFYDIATLTTTTENVHNEYRIVWSTGPSGSGDLNYSDIVGTRSLWNVVSPLGSGWFGVALRYKRDLYSGMVHVYGGALTTTTSPAQIIGAVPVGYRPTYATSCLIFVTTGGVTTPKSGYIEVSTGNIGFVNAADVPTTSGDTIYISVSFPII